VNVARDQRLVGRRRAVDSDRFDGESLVAKKASVWGHQQGKAAVGNSGIATRMVSCAGADCAINPITTIKPA